MKKNPWANDPVVKRLVHGNRGRFRKVILKEAGKRQTKEGSALKDWLDPLMREHYSNEEFAERVHYQLDTEMPLPVPFIRGNSGTIAPQEVSFVYLDVGAWVGSANKPWGRADNGTGKTLKRDFGVICGPLVLLCSFTHAYKTAGCDAWQKANKSNEPFASVNALLKKLSVKSSELGEVVVRDMAVASAANPRWPEDPEDWVIHVIVGDMHIPVLDKEVQTYGGTATVVGGHVQKPGFGETKSAVDPHQYVETTTVPARVPRLGRVDVRPLEDLVKRFVGPEDKDGADGLRKLVDLGTKFMQMPTTGKVATTIGVGIVMIPVTGVALPRVVPAAIEESWRRGDWDGIKDDTMTADDAERWYKYYLKPEEGKPADIFEGAGSHFLEFMARIGHYMDEHEQHEHLPVKFLQLGDMLDFWVGFTCHYDPAPIPDMPVRKVHEYGERMVKTWAANLFGNTEQGKLVASAIHIADEKKLHPVYLYGNHDNYLGAKFAVSYPVDGQKHPVRLAKRRARYQGQGLFMEHGHQWEPSNADSAEPQPVGMVIGTPSPLGMFVTQTAFIRPGPIRAFEGAAAGFFAELFGGYGQRMDQIVGAVRRFWEMQGGFYCYVMGHTHSACLSQIVLSTKYDGTLEAFRKEHENDPRTRLYFSTPDQGFEITEEVYVKSRDYKAAEVRVDWVEMLGAKEHEWVSLEDPRAPVPGNLDRAIKGLAMPNRAGPKGHFVFEAPPGLYVARFYLTREAGASFRETRNKLAVEGISVEGGDIDKHGRPVFEFNGKTFVKPIHLRWAYDPKRFDSDNAFFALYREHEPIESTSILSNNPPHPIYKFVKVQPNGPMFGRVCLSRLDSVSWDFHDRKRKPYGTWVVRAFMDQAAKRPIGTATFEIREVKRDSAKRNR